MRFSIRNVPFLSRIIKAVTGSPPAAPVANVASNVASFSFQANWQVSTGADGYYLDVATDIGFTVYVSGFQNLQIVGGAVVSQQVTGLAASTNYYYRVRAYNTFGTSGNSLTISTTTTAFTPASITGLSLWLDANVGVTESLGSVSTWADQSSNANDATFGGPAAPPIYSSSDSRMNNFPAIDFTVSGVLQCANPVCGYPLTIFVVMNEASGAPVCVSSIISDSFPSTLYSYYSCVASTISWYTGADNASSPISNDVAGLVEMMGDGNQSFRFWWDGAELGSPSINAGGTALNTAPITIGDFLGDGANSFQGVLAEILVYNSLLNATDQGHVREYLRTKRSLF